MASGELEFNLGNENIMGRKLKHMVHDWSSSFYTLASHPHQHCIFGMGVMCRFRRNPDVARSEGDKGQKGRSSGQLLTTHGHGDPLATLATIQSWPHQQVNRQYLMSPTLLPYPITIDHEQRSPFALSSSSSLLSTLSLSARAYPQKDSCHPPLPLEDPRTLITNASTAMPPHRSLPFATLRYDP